MTAAKHNAEHHDARDLNLAKVVLNNITGCTSSYANNNFQLGAVDMRSSKLVSGYNDGPVGGDPYMSFIDSDKFSPI